MALLLALLALSSSILCLSAAADPPDNRGTEFVIGFTKNYRNQGKNNLFITCLQDTAVTVDAPGAKFKQTFNLKAKELKTIDLPISLRMNVANGIENKGILVTSTKEVIVYGISLQKATTDAFLALPTDIQSDRYILASIKPTTQNANLGVVASRDDTTITVKPPGKAVITKKLNRLQTYHYSVNADLTGTIVTADKPVSVYSGAECTRVGNVGACDHLVEQIPPVNTWGKRFATVPIAGRRIGDIFRIIASEDNTAISIPAMKLTQVRNTAQFYEIVIPSEQRQLITCSKPCLVMQYNKGQSSDIKADPFMIMVPPIEQYAANYVLSTSQSAEGQAFSNQLSIAIEGKHKDGLILDGKPLKIAWLAVPDTNLVGGTLTIAHGRHEIYHKSPIVPFAAYMYGYRDYDSYGYPGGLRLAPIAIPCKPSTPVPLDGLDNDCDGLIDEELKNGKDDDGDGKIDEDIVALPPTLAIPTNFTASVCSLTDKTKYAPTVAGKVTAKASSKCEAIGKTQVNYQDNVLSNANCETVIERVWSVLDGCKNVMEHTQYIRLSIKKPQYNTQATASVLCKNAAEGRAKTSLTPKVTNPCPTNTVTLTEKTPATYYSGKCTGQTVSRSWQAREKCGRVTTLTQKLTLQGFGAPTLTKPKDYSNQVCNLQSKAEIDPSKTGQLTAKVHPECERLGKTRITYADKTISNANCKHVIQRTWSVTDGCGQKASHVQTITLEMIRSTIAVTVPPTATILCINANELKSKTNINPVKQPASCPGQVFTVTETTPASVYSGKCTGQTITRTWQVSESCGRKSTLAQKVTLTTKVPPKETKPKDYSKIVCDANSADEVDPAKTGRLTAVVSPHCEKLKATEIDYTDKVVKNANCIKQIQRTWKLVDGCGHTVTHVQNIQLSVSKPSATVPKTGELVCSKVEEVKSVAGLQPKLNNPCPQNKVTVVDTTSAAKYAAACSGQTVQRTWEVRESCGRVSTISQNVLAKAKVPPKDNKPKDYSKTVCDVNNANEIDPTKTGRLTAIVSPDCEKLKATKIDYTDKVVKNADCVKQIQRTWKLVDGCGQTVTHVQNIQLSVSKPSATVPKTGELVCSKVDEVKSVAGLQPKLNNPCPQNKVTVVDTTSAAKYAAACSGQTVQRTWEVRESCGRVSTISQNVLAKAKVPPKDSKPKDYSKTVCDVNNANEIDPTKTGSLTAVVSPDCEKLKATQIDYTDKVIKNADCVKQIQRTWKLVDGCGHTVTHVQNIQLSVSKPSATVPKTGELVCSKVDEVKSVAGLQPKLNNPCPQNKVTVVDTTSAAKYAAACSGQTVQRTWEVRESCGRVSTISQNVLAKAKVPPKDSKPKDYSKTVCDVNNANEIDPTKTGRLTAVVSPDCEKLKATQIDYTDKVIKNADCVKQIQRTWKLVDGCAHTVTHVQNIQLSVIKPSATVPKTGELVCSKVDEVKSVAGLQPKLNNRCLQNKVTVVDTTSAAKYAAACSGQTVQRTWEVRESCGRRSTISQNVLAKAKVPPKDSKPKDYSKTVCDVNNANEIDPTKTGRLTAVVSPDCEKLKATEIDYTDKVIKNADCVKQIQRTWKLVDGCAHTVTHVQNIQLSVIKPSATVPKTGELVCSKVDEVKSVAGLQPKLNNPCPQNKVTVVDTTSAAKYAAACSGQTVQRTWEVRESCGRISTISQNVLAKAKVPPKITKPTDYTKEVCQLNLSSEISSSKTGSMTAVVSPDCEKIRPTRINYIDKVVQDGNCQKVIERTWSLIDGCGHTDRHVQKITLTVPSPTVQVQATAEMECDSVSEAISNNAFQPKILRNPCAGNSLTITETTASALLRGECKDQVITRTWTVKEACGRTNTLTQKLTLKERGCFARVADIVFALDDSGSLNDDDFIKMKEFLINVVKAFDIGFDKTRVGVLTYNDGPIPQFELNSYFTKGKLMGAIDRIKKTSGATKTSQAIDYMRKTSFSVGNGDRVLVKNVGIIVTDGKSSSRVLTALQARLAKEAGMIIFAIGVGSDVDVNELNDISSDPDSSYVFTVESFAALKSIQNEVAIGACIATNPPPTTVSTTPPTTTARPTTPACVDRADCTAYGDNVCTEYPEWSRENCYGTCYCESTPPPSTTTTKPCVDVLPNCQLYLKSYCTEFRAWAQGNCAKYCGLC